MTYTLILLRHGNSDWNQKNLFTGWVDVRLSDQGVAEATRAGELLAPQFAVAAGSALFHSVIVHFENAAPIQVEDRWVNPACAPRYLEQDFAAITPNAHLMEAAPLQGATYSIEALPAPREVADMLAIDARQCCLVLKRRTTSMGMVASVVTMWHPGQLYQYTGSVG